MSFSPENVHLHVFRGRLKEFDPRGKGLRPWSCSISPGHRIPQIGLAGKPGETAHCEGLPDVLKA